MVNKMALGIPVGGNGGGSFLPIVKWNAKAGRFFRVDRVQNSTGSYENTDEDITNTVKFVADLEQVEVGPLAFVPGKGPDFRGSRIGAPVQAAPTTDYKPGMRMLLKLDKASGGDVREFLASSGSALSAIDVLHDAFLAGATGDNAGKLPVVKIARITALKGDKGTNYAPVFEIVSWVARPADMPLTDAPARQAAAPAPATPPSTGSRTVAAPAPTPAPAREMADAEDFG